MKSDRRSIFKKILMGTTGLFGLSAVNTATAKTEEDDEIVTNNVTYDDQVPLFSGSQTYGGLVYVAGKGAHFDGDIKAHTKHVLDEIEKELEKAGSGMDRVLKVNVYLHDLNDYKEMNETYRGRFGDNPPVRTTIAPYGGVPGNSLVEIDCIAALKKK
ncbi:MAG: RidA family protein [Cyclobacteriaceae bacterium]|nr:RidA family protein [Cyclobacteriaceae bacterium SS2]